MDALRTQIPRLDLQFVILTTKQSELMPHMMVSVEHHVITMENKPQEELINVGQPQMLTLKPIFGQQAQDVRQQLMITVSVMHSEVGQLILMEFLVIVTQLLMLLENKEMQLMEMRMNVGEKKQALLQMTILPEMKLLTSLMKLQNL